VPTRALWQSDGYFGKSPVGRLIRPALGLLQSRDVRAADRIDQMLTISAASQEMIARCYRRNADILYCPIDTDRFSPQGRKKDHFLIVSRFDHWKRLDYAVEAFRRLDYPLRIVGKGPEEAYLKSIAGPRTEFVGTVSDEQLAIEYSMARALVFTPFIEGGMTVVEANACGTPTICYGAGGIPELQIDTCERERKGDPTSVFFHEQTPEAVIEAVRKFEAFSFEPAALVRHAVQFSVPQFKSRMRSFVEKHVR
jgi:glycosyltransferase involved in cell wall biosynthesis